MVLKIVSERIREIFDGEIKRFLETGETGDFNGLLNKQFSRLSEIEQQIGIWLVIERDPMSLERLKDSLVFPASEGEISGALAALKRRHLVDRIQDGFTLQNLVMGYLTED